MSLILTPVAHNSRLHRGKRWATLWRLARTDGVTFHFTNSDKIIRFDSNTVTIGNPVIADYTPVGGLDASAKRRELGLRANNLEYRGVISSGAITSIDLQAGRYRDAKIEEFIVDAKLPFLGAIVHAVGYVQETRLDGDMWVATVAGVSHRLTQRVGGVFSKRCPFEVFATGRSGNGSLLRNCSKEKDGYQSPDPEIVAQTAFPIVVLVGEDVLSFNPSEDARHAFAATDDFNGGIPFTPGIQGVPLRTTGFFDEGLVTMQTGANAGLQREIKEHIGLASHAFRTVEPFPFDLAVGDTFHIQAGCDKTKDGEQGCIIKFSHLNGNSVPGSGFGGFSFIRGPQDPVRGPFNDETPA